MDKKSNKGIITKCYNSICNFGYTLKKFAIQSAIIISDDKAMDKIMPPLFIGTFIIINLIIFMRTSNNKISQ